jgi:hypothetical protein
MATRYNYTGGIVTNGLVLNLDAAKTDSYPGTGTTWRDLSGNGNNGTLTNGPTFSGIGKQASIVFDGVDDYVNLGNPSNLQFGTGDFTISIWVYPKVVSYGINDQGTLLSKDYFGIELYIYQTKFRAYIGGTSNSISAEITTLTANTWYNFVLSRSNYFCTSYVNSVLDGSRLNSSNINNPGVNYSVGRRTGSSALTFNGYIPTVQIYNRSLSQTEVTQNFNALRGRYGI